MNDNVRGLLRCVCEGDMIRAQVQARIMLNGIDTKRDQDFKLHMLRKLDNNPAHLMELPANLKGILVAEDTVIFPENRFLLRPEEDIIVNKLLNTYSAATRLAELGISYLPSAILHGPSGTGKTMLARYIAHRAGLPFAYVKFSALIDSLLGGTGKNLNRIFDYVKRSPCVLCLDEIDAIGGKRGQNGDSGGTSTEMGRVVIGLMQELDACPNSVLLIATTNRFDILDEALVNRFSVEHPVSPFCMDDIIKTVEMFFAHTGCGLDEPADEWCRKTFQEGVSTRQIIRTCTEQLVSYMVAHPSVEV